MRKWLRRVGIAIVMLAVASAVSCVYWLENAGDATLS